MSNSIKLLGSKSFTSKKDGRNWTILHCVYSDSSYQVGLACDSIFVESSCINGILKSQCSLSINRSPDGRRVISVDVVEPK